MNREELTEKVLTSTSNSIVLELPTGFGKSYLALQKVARWHTEGKSILIAVPKNVLKPNWVEEIKKWKFDYLLKDIIFTTYVSLPKYIGKSFDSIVLDEAHHTSERCIDALKDIKVKHILALSATLKKEHKLFFTSIYNAEIIKVATKEAIESEVLPDPKIILIPLKLDNRVVNCAIEKHIKANTKPSDIKTIGIMERWKYNTYKSPLRILCTQQQYYNDLSNTIEWYKKKGMYNAIMKNVWLHKAGERLKWLASQKEELMKILIKRLKNYRLIAFCPSIEESNKLGCPCINSKIGTENLDKFNAKKIKHIACVSMIDEGMNLTDCKIGIFQMINASFRVSQQREGRILRHKEPVFIFPYYINTREEEIVNGIIADYNPELIYRMNIEDIKTVNKFM